MSGFIPTIPQAGDKFSFSQGQLLSNNAALDAVFGTDHFSFSQGSGFHQQITLPVLISEPLKPNLANSIRMFSKLVGGQPYVYGKRSDDSVVAIEPASNLAQSGYVQLGALCMKWGKVTASITDQAGSQSFPYENTVPFNATPWITLVSFATTSGSVAYCWATPDPSDSTTLKNNIQITWQTNSGAAHVFYYLSIGQVV